MGYRMGALEAQEAFKNVQSGPAAECNRALEIVGDINSDLIQIEGVVLSKTMHPTFGTILEVKTDSDRIKFTAQKEKVSKLNVGMSVKVSLSERPFREGANVPQYCLKRVLSFKPLKATLAPVP